MCTSKVMLDALGAEEQHDYRKAILFSAIAMEVCVRRVIDDAHVQVLATRMGAHRVIEVGVAGGARVAKDPIYDLMIKAADRLARLLHEQSLYILNRSLLVENEALYREAVELYSTRNKIMHEGMPAEGGGILSIDASGAWRAIKTATEVLAWLGDAGPYLSSTGQPFV
jgi:hypothetical protein